MRAMCRVIASHSNTAKVASDTGYFIGIPDIIWEICQVQWGRMWWKNEVRRKQLEQHLLCNIFGLLPHTMK